MKLALLLNAIDPGVGGVLIRGQKGTAKSTAVRGLAQLLPSQPVVQGCPCGCHPFEPDELCPRCQRQAAEDGELPVAYRDTPVVDLPLNATEDMVLGSFDFKRALQNGIRCFQPGLLAKAHRGFLYADEVNLLVDHLVDVIMDATGSGINVVEREGISHWHASRFSLVGTMNPEEGELRPQLLDRFGLCVAVQGEQDPELRMRLMELRESFDACPQIFAQSRRKDNQAIAQAVSSARSVLPEVVVDRHICGFISNLCLEKCVAGHRADLVLRRATRALAAYEGRVRVCEEDVSRIAPMVFLHRQRQAQTPPPAPPPPQAESSEQKDADQNDGGGPDAHDATPPSSPAQQTPENEPQGQNTGQEADAGQHHDAHDSAEQNTVFEIGATFKVRHFQSNRDRALRTGSGRRSLSRTATRRGRYSRSVQSGPINDLALDATLRAASVHQAHRPPRPGMALAIERVDWRYKMREARVGNFLLFVMDASGSMGAQARMVAAKGAVMSLLLDAYQKRDKISLISFRGNGAEMILPATSSIETSARLLQELPVGGRTPLAQGLVAAHQELTRQLRREPECRPIALLITDGKASYSQDGENPWARALHVAALAGADRRIQWMVVDTECKTGFSLDLAKQLAQALNAGYFGLEQLKARDLIELARS